jgi:hypothetical protein
MSVLEKKTNGQGTVLAVHQAGTLVRRSAAHRIDLIGMNPGAVRTVVYQQKLGLPAWLPIGESSTLPAQTSAEQRWHCVQAVDQDASLGKSRAHLMTGQWALVYFNFLSPIPY